jgi:hypothetical protein
MATERHSFNLVGPAKAGTQGKRRHSATLDSRFRGNDGGIVAPISEYYVVDGAYQSLVIGD